MIVVEDFRIRLEVEGMRHQVIHAFAAHQGEIREIVDERLSAVLDAWRIDADIDRAIQVELDRVVGKIIQEEVAAVLGGKAVRDALQIGVGLALTSALTTRGLLPDVPGAVEGVA